MGLLGYSIFMRFSAQSLNDEMNIKQTNNTFSLIGVVLNHIVKSVILYFFYFYKGELNYGKMIGARLIFCVGVNAFLIYHYIINRESLSLFWGPFLVEEIVMDMVGSCSVMWYAYTYYSVKVQWDVEFHLRSEMNKLI